jgi:phosphoribosyl 1,2-cyclic phosphate phosphodiesterase
VKITFLGTGTSQGVPIIACNCKVCKSSDWHDKRLRSSIMIEHNNVIIIIDSGPDFRYQMLRENVKRIDAILFTHEHKDHTAGLDDIRAYNYVSGKPMDIYAEERVQTSLRREFAYIFENESYPGVPKVIMHSITPDSSFNVTGINVVPIRLQHHQLPILGFRIDDFAYLTDIKHISSEEKIKLKDCQYLVVSGLRKEEHACHFSFSEAIGLINEIKPKKGYITHISHQLGLYNELLSELPENISIAYDQMIILI